MKIILLFFYALLINKKKHQSQPQTNKTKKNKIKQNNAIHYEISKNYIIQQMSSLNQSSIGAIHLCTYCKYIYLAEKIKTQIHYENS